MNFELSIHIFPYHTAVAHHRIQFSLFLKTESTIVRVQDSYLIHAQFKSGTEESEKIMFLIRIFDSWLTIIAFPLGISLTFFNSAQLQSHIIARFLFVIIA